MSSALSWVTFAGSIGTFPAGQALEFQLHVTPLDPSSIVRYTLLSGELPTGISTQPVNISLDGLITGTLDIVDISKTSSFTVRASDQYGNVTDRTFSITVVNNSVPRFTTPSGSLLTTVDSVYVSYNIAYSNVVSTNTVAIRLSSGELPPGLRIDLNGLISGYAKPPILFDKSPTTKTYTFSLQLYSELGNDTNTYSITVSNYQLNHTINSRVPAILNTRPTVYPIPATDEYYSYYLGSDGLIGTINANEYFSFKIIGYDFDGSNITYSFYNLPTGLSGDPVTGWITGSVSMASIGINRYQFYAKVQKTDFPTNISEPITFILLVSNQLENDIKWVTDSDLGIIYNGTISELSVQATSARSLVYTLTSGQLPPNLILSENGELAGRVAFQPISELLQVGAQSTFTFTISAYASDYPLIKKEKQFTINVYQMYADPFETVYIKASPSVANRQVLKSLLSDTNIIPTKYLYRVNDPYFGKAKDIRFAHAYGMKPKSIPTYINAVQNNHYIRRIFLGDLKLAVGRDSNSNIIYEVVYSEIIDDLVNPNGQSVGNVVSWGTNNSNVNSVKPGSLDNMKNELLKNIDYNPDIKLLPKWMNTQQLTGNTTGYIRGWVLCYTKYEYAVNYYDSNNDPVYFLNSDGTKMTNAQKIKYNIENEWAHKLNEIEFIVDRYIVDKSATYDWNLSLQIPTWSELPSATPAPATLEDYNISVLFPKKSIID